MKTLTVGGGGREHAMMREFELAGVEQLATQANAGMEALGQNLAIGNSNLRRITAAALEHEVDFVAIGPEAPLIAGLANRLRRQGIPTLGFSRKAARLEGSKAYAAEFTEEFGIVAPKSYVADNFDEANHYAATHSACSYVIKADGPANGKGVILPERRREAQYIVARMMSGELFGKAGKRIVMQERLSGPEVSMFAVLDGTKKATVLFMAQDHKRLKDNDKGPNTGGMGAYSPVPPKIVSEQQVTRMHEALDKTMNGMLSRGIASPGILYLGFMLADQLDGDPALMEYNVRFGDPEAQVVLPLLTESGVDVHELFYAAARGSLEGDRINVIEQSGRAALTVCLAAEGYPDTPRKGDTIHGIDREYEDVIVHHGGTARGQDEANEVFTAGGRVLYVTGLGDTVPKAARKAYAAIGKNGIRFNGMQYRKDIGRQAIKTK